MAISRDNPQTNGWTFPTSPLPWLIASVLLLGGAILLWSPNYRWGTDKGDSPYGSDFLQDWTGANMIGAGQASQLYDPATFDAWQHDARRIGFTWNTDAYYPTVYPPPYYLLAVPLGWLEYRWAVWLWLGILLCCLVAAAAIMESTCRGRDTAQHGVWFWPAMLLFPPLLLSLTMGQKGAVWLLIWAATWGLLQRQRPLLAGLIFGLLSVKPTLFFLLPLVMLYHRQWRFVLGASLSFGGLWLAAASLLPPNVWPEFLDVARGAGNYHQHAGYQLNWSCNLVALAGGLQHPWLPNWTPYLLLGVLASYTLARSVGVGDRIAEPFDARHAKHWAQVLLATCLLSPHFYAYDLVVLLLPIGCLWNTHRWQALALLGSVWGGMQASQLCHDTVGLPLMPVVLLGTLYLLSTVTPGQSSVRKGVSGRPAPSNILQTGLSAQA